MKYLLRWIVPASALEGEWTAPAPTDFEYRMMLMRESLRQFRVALLLPFREAIQRWFY